MHDTPLDNVYWEVYQEGLRIWVPHSMEQPFVEFARSKGVKLHRMEIDGMRSDSGPVSEYSTESPDALVKSLIDEWVQNRTQ